MPASRAHAIPKRDLHFDLSGIELNRWHPKGPQLSHYFNVHSLQFPRGERFFINSVRAFRARIGDPELKKQIAGFVAQEAMHGREHEAYNARLGEFGYPAVSMDKWVGRVLWLAQHTMLPKDRLAMTVALEHLTAIGAKGLLEDERILEGTPQEMARLWRWHAMEETEHKAVAFDVYREVAGEGAIAWLRRCFIMLLVSASMTLLTWSFLLWASIRTGTVLNLRSWGALFWSLWVSPGDVRRQFPLYWKFFRRDFHPWQIDNYAQVERWRSAYGDDGGAAPVADRPAA